MHAGRDQPIGMVRTEKGREPAEARADAVDRCAVPRDAVVREPADGAPSPEAGPCRRAKAGPAADGEDGARGGLPATAHHGAASGAPEMALSAAKPRGRPAGPGLVRRYHVH